MADLITREAAVDILVDMHGLCRGDVLGNALMAIHLLPAVAAVPVDWLRKKMQKPLMTCDNPFDYVLSTWQDEQRKKVQDDCNYNDE